MHTWIDRGRTVKKGENAILIFARAGGKREPTRSQASLTEDPSHLAGFRTAQVFDVSQTESAKLPAMREMNSEVGENRARLISFFKKQNI